MEPNQIKQANFLDIVFEGRNKEYGAYELRKTYNRRVVKSMIVMGSMVILVCVGGVVMGFAKGKRVGSFDVGGDVIFQSVKDPQVLPPPPPPRVVQPQVATRIFTPPLIVKEDVKPDEKPPENSELDHVQIGTVNKAGVADGEIVGPPSNGLVAGVVDQPKKSDGDDRFIPIEKEAEFPGGKDAWARFLNKTLRYPDEALNIGIDGMVIVQFVVDVDGSISDVQVVSGPEKGGLREEAMRVIKKSGKWVPALQNGRSVKAYRRQPVVFKQVTEN
ncbi:MAG TPA: energy transducer TonB [Puia sp.]|jgi:protein TonB|nr:energy transducer TonB [Puia sp.]